jgi:hypothetical protein
MAYVAAFDPEWHAAADPSWREEPMPVSAPAFRPMCKDCGYKFDTVDELIEHLERNECD